MAPIAPELAAIARRYRASLARAGIEVEQILLFGSHLSGRAHEGSDIDLVIISPDWLGKGLLDRQRILGVAAARILEPIEAVGFTPEEIQRGEVSAFWKEVLRSRAVALAA